MHVFSYRDIYPTNSYYIIYHNLLAKLFIDPLSKWKIKLHTYLVVGLSYILLMKQVICALTHNTNILYCHHQHNHKHFHHHEYIPHLHHYWGHNYILQHYHCKCYHHHQQGTYLNYRQSPTGLKFMLGDTGFYWRISSWSCRYGFTIIELFDNSTLEIE